MRRYQGSTAELNAEHGIQIGRWAQYAELGELPFNAMWCVIPPAGTSRPDQHPEVELSVVVSGHATYESGGQRVDAPAGSAILLASEEPHVIHNESAEEPLNLLSIYWMPAGGDDA